MPDIVMGAGDRKMNSPQFGGGGFYCTSRDRCIYTAGYSVDNEATEMGREIMRGQRKSTSLSLGCLLWGQCQSGRGIWVKETNLNRGMELRNMVSLENCKPVGVAGQGGMRLERVERTDQERPCVSG